MLAGQNAWFDKTMIFASDLMGYILVAFLLLLFLKNKKKYKDLLLLSLVSAAIARFVITTAIHLIHYNPRPFVALRDAMMLVSQNATSSFPSGHAAFYFALATGVYLYNKKLGLVYLVLAGLMGFARIFVGVHWPLDILAGAILGILVAYPLRSKLKRNK